MQLIIDVIRSIDKCKLILFIDNKIVSLIDLLLLCLYFEPINISIASANTVLILISNKRLNIATTICSLHWPSFLIDKICNFNPLLSSTIKKYSYL